MTRFHVIMCGSGNYGGKEFDHDLRQFPNPLFDPWIKGDFRVWAAPFINRMSDVQPFWCPLWHLSCVCDGVLFCFPKNDRYTKEMLSVVKAKYPTFDPGNVPPDGFYDPDRKYAIAFNLPGTVLHELAHLGGWRHSGFYYG